MAELTGTASAPFNPPAPREGSTVVRASISHSATPVFSCLADGTVVNWNSAAEQLFGVGADEARHHKCWETVAGLDIFGNDYCFQHCPIREMASRGRPINLFRLRVRGACGRRILVRTMILAPRNGDGQPEIIHLFDPLEPAARSRDRLGS